MDIAGKSKRDEEQGHQETFIRDCSVHPSLSVVLVTDQQLKEIGQFCTNPHEFCVLSIDPTFNIFDTNLSLTVTTYRNLKLRQKQTGKPPVFIGPLLIHQRKDWQTYSRFAHNLRTENPILDAILACGTDGEQALIDGFKRNFRYAVFLRCFIHFKDNVEREMSKRGIAAGNKQLILEGIFGEKVWDNKVYWTCRL